MVHTWRHTWSTRVAQHWLAGSGGLGCPGTAWPAQQARVTRQQHGRKQAKEDAHDNNNNNNNNNSPIDQTKQRGQQQPVQQRVHAAESMLHWVSSGGAAATYILQPRQNCGGDVTPLQSEVFPHGRLEPNWGLVQILHHRVPEHSTSHHSTAQHPRGRTQDAEYQHMMSLRMVPRDGVSGAGTKGGGGISNQIVPSRRCW